MIWQANTFLVTVVLTRVIAASELRLSKRLHGGLVFGLGLTFEDGV